MSSILIFGYYGFKNLGDDLMLNELIETLRGKGKIDNFYILCKNSPFDKSETDIKHVEFSKWNLAGILLAILKSKVVLWGGGTCLFESETNRGLKELLFIIKLCTFFRKKFVLFNIGVGKSVRPDTISLIEEILKRSDKIVVREEDSYNLLLSDFGAVVKEKISVGADLIYTLFNKLSSEAVKMKYISANTPLGLTNKEYITFSGVYNYAADVAGFYANVLHKISVQSGKKIVFLPAHLGERSDNIFHEKIKEFIEQRYPEDADRFTIANIENANEFLSLVGGAYFHIGFRLHSVVIADFLGIPNIGINYSPKVKSYLSYELNAKRVFEMYEDIPAISLVEVINSFPLDRNYNDMQVSKLMKSYAVLGEY
jgi:polysaccharide pyruvyl transferase WcaK-like protein